MYVVSIDRDTAMDARHVGVIELGIAVLPSPHRESLAVFQDETSASLRAGDNQKEVVCTHRRSFLVSWFDPCEVAKR